MYTHNPEYEQLRELGRQIMHTDPTKAAVIQAQLGQVCSQFKHFYQIKEIFILNYLNLPLFY